MTTAASNLFRRFFLIEPSELSRVGLSFVYFFCLLAGYFVLRPLRETTAIREGTEALPWLYSGVFIIMLLIMPLFGWLVARLPKQRFLPAVYSFFIVTAVAFAGFFGGEGDYSLFTAASFYIWLSVFNLFVVSVFWSFMVDLFDGEQAKRLFPVIAAGGSLGAMGGPLLTRNLVGNLGIQWLIILAAALLVLALVCQIALLRTLPEDADHHVRAPIGGSVVAGATEVFRNRYLRGIALLLFFLPVMNTFLYFIQGELVYNSLVTDADRARFFASVDFWANLIAFLCPLVLTGRLLQWLGPAKVLVIMPVLTLLGYLAIAVAPTLLTLAIVQAVRRGGEYGLMKPVRKLLWTKVSEENKYKAQNFVDTAIYRAGDTATGWVYAVISSAIGTGVALIALLAAPLAGIWAMVALRMGRVYERE